MNKKIVYINSNNRVSGTHSNFQYKIDLPPNNGYKNIVLLQALIPKTYHLIEDGYNTFQLQESSGTFTITMPEGNYSWRVLRTILEEKLNEIGNYTYVVSISSSLEIELGKLTISVSTNGAYQPSLIFSSENNMYEILGFDIGSTNTFVSDVILSTNVCKLQLEDALFIHCDACDNIENDVLQDIFIDVSDFSNIIFQQFDREAYTKKLRSNNNNVYNISIRDENGRLLNTHNLNCCFTIMFS